MRSIPFMLAGAVALVVAGCGSSVELFPDDGSGGTGGSGASGSTESGTPSGAGGDATTTTSAGVGGASVGSGGPGATSGAATSGGTTTSGNATSGAATSSGVGASSGVATSSGVGASGAGGSSSASGQPSSGPVGSAVATSGTGGVYCPHDVCETGEPLDPFCNECTMKIYQQDPSCSDMWWHEGCVYLAAEQCGCFDPGCATCSDFLNGSSEPLCPGSEALVNDLYSCACGYACPYECSDACMGAFTTPECQSCVVTLCSYQFDACLNDF